jgi:hypothetical protein
MDNTPVDFTIIGISSHENDYRLSWSINEQLGLMFAQGDSIVTDAGNEFTCFVHDDGQKRLMLISNRCDNGFLLEKCKNFDFILKFNTELNETDTSSWLSDLRKVPLVSAAFPIPVNKKVLQLLG